MGKYAIGKCPSCGYLQVVEIVDKNHLYSIRTKCRFCNRTYKLIYKNKPSWSGNLAILAIFDNFQDAKNKLIELKQNSKHHS